MIELNHIFLFIAIVSPLAVLARGWRPNTIYHGWRIAAIIVLVITTVAWLFFRNSAGYIAGAAWFALLFLPAIGLKRVGELSAARRYRSARRLAAALQWVHPSPELRHQVSLLGDLKNRQAVGIIPPPATEASATSKLRSLLMPKAPAVMAFILVNVIAFTIELGFGSWTAPNVLHRLGALEPEVVINGGEYWRLLTALFLHAGAVHLLFNLFALYVLGPSLERSVGTLRFVACYLGSGLGSSLGVLVLWRMGWNSADQLVGASGCIMGVVGAWGGFLLRHRHIPLAKRRLTNVIMIVAIQTAFDLTTRQVSLTAHVCGLVSGFIMGVLISPVGSNRIQ